MMCSFGRPDYLSKVYTIKKIYEQYLPLNIEELKNIQKLERYSEVYNSNSIEGNSYNEFETASLLDTGFPIPSKSLKDGIEILNLNKAILFCDFYKGEFDIKFIKTIHRIITAGTLDNPLNEGEFKKVRNWVGDINTTPPNAVNKEMNKLMEWYYSSEEGIDPVLLAIRFKYRFLTIHPFADGNGRTSRVLLNYILKKHDISSVKLDSTDRSLYYKALKESNRVSEEHNNKFKCEPLEEFLCDCIVKSYERRIKMLET